VRRVTSISLSTGSCWRGCPLLDHPYPISSAAAAYLPSFAAPIPLYCFEFHVDDVQVQEVAAHLNVHLPSQEGEDTGALTSRRKPPPPSSKTSLAAITLKNHPLSLPPAPPKQTPPHQNQIVVDDFGAPAPPPPETDECDGGAGVRRPQAARRGVAGSLGGRKIVER
jgi:hypothetical protein